MSEELNLHRETSHLAVNLLDRYLSATKDFPKEYFQLLGVSSLFIAAKVEEIYSPKVQEFSDVTDGACSVEAIHKMELKLLPTLSWRLAAPTAQSFAGLFLQNAARLTREDPSEGTIHAGSQLDCPMSRLKYFVGPRYETEIFMEVMNLIDTAIHRAEVYRFLNSTLAAAAVFTVVQARGGNTPAFVHNLEMACGRKMHEISDCIAWISAFRDYPLQIAEQIPRFVVRSDHLFIRVSHPICSLLLIRETFTTSSGTTLLCFATSLSSTGAMPTARKGNPRVPKKNVCQMFNHYICTFSYSFELYYLMLHIQVSLERDQTLHTRNKSTLRGKMHVD